MVGEFSRRRVLMAAGAAVGSAGCMELPGVLDREAETPTSTATPTETGPETTRAPVDEGSYAAVYRQSIDSVIAVRVFSGVSAGEGSGFFMDGRHVVTNHHVVESANEIHLGFRDGDWRSASVLATDEYSDLAVLEVPDPPDYAGTLPFVETEPPIGTRVLAIGNPFGLKSSASSGIISGVDRSLPGPNDFSIPDAVQTDAAVNPGNSGGPLVTLDGSVVGVITAAGGENVGFAISAALAERVLPALVETGSYDHAYMGVRLLTVTPTVAEANDLDRAGGVLVVDVLDGGPSDGVLHGSDGSTRVNGRSVPTGGDVILALDDTPTPTLDHLSTFLALETSPGDAIDVTVLRGGSRRTVELTLGERPPPSRGP